MLLDAGRGFLGAGKKELGVGNAGPFSAGLRKDLGHQDVPELWQGMGNLGRGEEMRVGNLAWNGQGMGRDSHPWD